MMQRLLRVVIGLFLIPAVSIPAASLSVSLQWDANTESDLGGYTIFQSNRSLLGFTTGQALTNQSIDTYAVAASNTEYSVAGLQNDTSYYFRIAAFNSGGVYSGLNVDNANMPSEVLVFYYAGAAQADHAVCARETFLSPGIGDGMNDVATFGPDAEEVTIYDVRGREYFHATGTRGAVIVWNCRNGAGEVVPAGAYIARIHARNGSTVYQKFAVIK